MDTRLRSTEDVEDSCESEWFNEGEGPGGGSAGEVGDERRVGEN